jgi:hypothetical protein
MFGFEYLTFKGAFGDDDVFSDAWNLSQANISWRGLSGSSSTIEHLNWNRFVRVPFKAIISVPNNFSKASRLPTNLYT